MMAWNKKNDSEKNNEKNNQIPDAETRITKKVRNPMFCEYFQQIFGMNQNKNKCHCRVI